MAFVVPCTRSWSSGGTTTRRPPLCSISCVTAASPCPGALEAPVDLVIPVDELRPGERLHRGQCGVRGFEEKGQRARHGFTSPESIYPLMMRWGTMSCFQLSLEP